MEIIWIRNFRAEDPQLNLKLGWYYPPNQKVKLFVVDDCEGELLATLDKDNAIDYFNRQLIDRLTK